MISKMKKLATLVLVICIGILSGKAFGQETEKKNERKGGIAVGGFDNTRQDKAVTRSVEVPEEKAVPAEKAAESMPLEQAAAPAQAPQPDKQAKEKQKAKKNSKAKGKKK
jgi:hypothetical protein